MERSPQRRIRPVVRCRVDWPLSLPTRHYHYRANRRRPLWCWVWLTGLDLSASAEATAHVLLEDFDVLKPKRISISVHSIKPRDFCDETHIRGGRPVVAFNRRLVGAAVKRENQRKASPTEQRNEGGIFA